MSITTYDGRSFDLDTAMHAMNPKLREKVIQEGYDPGQDFFDRYAALHLEHFEEAYDPGRGRAEQESNPEAGWVQEVGD